MKELCGTVLVNNTTRELRYAAVGPLAPYVPQVWRQGALSTNFDQVCMGKCARVPIAPPMKGLTGTAPMPSTTRVLACATVGTLGLYVVQAGWQGAISTNLTHVCMGKYVWMHIAPSHEGIDQSA